MRNNQMKAVHQRDLKRLLTSLGVYDAVCNQTETCFFCHEVIDKNTIMAVFPFDGEVCFCCEKATCCGALLDLESDGKDDG